jgi:hypothetical protein
MSQERRAKKPFTIPTWLEGNLMKRKITLGTDTQAPLTVRIRERINYKKYIKGEL